MPIKRKQVSYSSLFSSRGNIDYMTLYYDLGYLLFGDTWSDAEIKTWACERWVARQNATAESCLYHHAGTLGISTN